MGSETASTTSTAEPVGSVPAAPPGDASLVRAVLGGDRAAFAALVDRHQRPALATCLALLRDRQLAEDAVQDAFVAAYRGLHALRDPSTFGGWLQSIARNRAARLARERTRRTRVAEDAASGRPQHAAPVPDPLMDQGLLAALAALPDHERCVLTLRYFDGHPVADIAAITGRPVGTVTKQIQRAHERLRAMLKPEELP